MEGWAPGISFFFAVNLEKLGFKLRVSGILGEIIINIDGIAPDSSYATRPILAFYFFFRPCFRDGRHDYSLKNIISKRIIDDGFMMME